MLKWLADILDGFFRPINAMFPVGTGVKLAGGYATGALGSPPAQGGDVIAPLDQLNVSKLVDRLPVWAENGAPTLLEKLRVPSMAYSKPAGPAPISLSGNEVRKPLNLEEAAWRASS